MTLKQKLLEYHRGVQAGQPQKSQTQLAKEWGTYSPLICRAERELRAAGHALHPRKRGRNHSDYRRSNEPTTCEPQAVSRERLVLEAFGVLSALTREEWGRVFRAVIRLGRQVVGRKS